MIICVIGAKGIVGNATFTLFNRLGYDVIGVDKNDAFPKADTYFICVNENKIEEVIIELSTLDSSFTVVIRSTVPPETCANLANKYRLHISHNPEFLREATALIDEFNPYRIVIGECCKTHGDYLENLYKPLCKPIVRVTPTLSEWVKLASNCYLSSVIAYWNMIDKLASKSGMSGTHIGMIASLDPRISTYGARFHQRFEGKCLPKDLRQLIQYGKQLGCDTSILESIEVNNHG